MLGLPHNSKEYESHRGEIFFEHFAKTRLKLTNAVRISGYISLNSRYIQLGSQTDCDDSNFFAAICHYVNPYISINKI